MKNIFLSIIALLGCLAASGQTLSLPPVSLSAGGNSINLCIDMDNPDQEITSLQFDLILPDGITVDGNAALTSRATGSHSVYANMVDSKYRVVVHSSNSAAITGTSGSIVTIPIIAAANLTSTDYTASLSDISLVTPEGNEISPMDIVGSITVTSVSLNISTISLTPEEAANISIDLNNPDQEITSLQFDLTLPEGIAVDGDAALTSRATGSHSIYSNIVDSKYRVVVHSSNSAALAGTSGSVVTIPIVAASDILPNDYSLTLSDISLVAPNGREINPIDINATIVVAPIAASSVTLDKTELTLEKDETTILIATVSPENTTYPVVTWASSDPAVATVDENGKVTAISEGTAAITASCGSVSATCTVTVTQKVEEEILGDADGNGEVSVSDAVNIVNYILGVKIDNFDNKAADVNGDGYITVADVVCVVDIVLGLASYETKTPSVQYAESYLTINPTSLQSNAVIDVPLTLCSDRDFTAMQFDVTLPNGTAMTNADGSALCGGHAVAWNALSEDAYRVLVYSLDNKPFRSREGEVLTLGIMAQNADVSGEIIIDNATGVTANGLSYSLPECRAAVSTSSLDLITNGNFKMRLDGRTLRINAPAEMPLTVTTLGGVATHLSLKPGNNAYTFTAPGIYIIANRKLIVK